MKVFIVDYETYKLMNRGHNGYFRNVELKTGNFIKDEYYSAFKRRIYGCNIFIVKKDNLYSIQKSHIVYFLKRADRKMSKRQMYAAFGKWIDSNSHYVLPFKAKRHYEQYEKYCSLDLLF